MRKSDTLAGAAMASGAAALLLGLLMLNGLVPMTGPLKLAFEGISFLGALLLAVCIVRSTRKARWTITLLGYLTAVSVLVVLVQYQFGCATAGKCF
jgi:hypothetical protein